MLNTKDEKENKTRRNLIYIKENTVHNFMSKNTTHMNKTDTRKRASKQSYLF